MVSPHDFVCLFADFPQTFSSEFSEQLEQAINTVLVAVQNLVKRREAQQQPDDQQSESKQGARAPCAHIQPKNHKPVSGL